MAMAQCEAITDQDQQMTEPVDEEEDDAETEEAPVEELTDASTETEYSDNDANDDESLSPEVSRFIRENSDILQQYRILHKIGEGT
jgi:hypothetical protein